MGKKPVIYAPALTGSMAHGSSWRNWMGTGVDMAFWTDKSIIKHNALMISYHYMERDKDIWRREHRLRSDVTLFVDSGGFQMINDRHETRDPLHVFEIQNKNADIGFILDVPPYKPGSMEPVLSREEYMRYVKETVRNVEAIIDRSRRFKLYGVLQGYLPWQIETWWKNVIEPYVDRYDGLALSFKPPSKFWEVAKNLFTFLSEREVHLPVHFLGISSPSVIALVLIFWKHWDKTVSMDSSSWVYAPKTGIYLLKPDARKLPFGRKVGFGGTEVPIKDLPCYSPVCQFAEEHGVDVNHLLKLTILPGDIMAFVSIHNLYVYLNIFRLLKFLVWYPDELWKTLKTLFTVDSVTIRNLQVLEQIISGKPQATGLSSWW